MRDYGDIVRRLRALEKGPFALEQIALRHDLPLFCLRRAGAAGHILLSAGTHGDEPAGPLAVLDFLERRPADLPSGLDLTVFPCLNPHGYIHDTRENGDGVDINRSFEDDSTPEAVLLKKLLSDQRFDLFIEFHEDWEFPGYYLFECVRGSSLGSRIVSRVEAAGMPIYDKPSIDDVPVHHGVATATDELLATHEIGYKPLPLWLFRGHTDHVITSETPSQRNLNERVAAHVTALAVALESVS